MGIFGSNKKTYVTSVVYNMAGDEFERPNYLRTMVVGAALNSTPSLSEAMTDSYLSGPGMRFRRFHKWADRTDYNDTIGFVSGTIRTGDSIDMDVLADEIPGGPVSLQSAEIGDADYTYWADQYVLENYPERIDTDYSSDFDEEDNLITITWEDTTTSDFTPVDYDKAASYLYAVYNELGVDPPMHIYIYKYESGNATLDAMFAPQTNVNGFYPVIPVRLNNKFVSEEYLPDVYTQAKKGYKKATTGSLDKLIEQLEDNEDLGDIDYTYIVFGVCLNVLEQSSRKYIFKFFEEVLNDFTGPGSDEYSDWQVAWNAAKDSWDVWNTWKIAQSDPLDPLYGTAEPVKLPYPAMPASSLKVSTGENPTINYDMTIHWSSISMQAGHGLLKPDAKRDQLWFTKGDVDTYEEVIWVNDDGGGSPTPSAPTTGSVDTVNTIVLNWQVTENIWRRLIIKGLKHTNMIYGGKAVEIDAVEALDDPEESGFIIPLHDGVFRELGLVDGTQMTTACSYLVFNCYTVVKKKWYQTGLFKVILIIIIVVISVFFPPAGAAAGGILGTNAAVGAAILGAGASALAIAIVGAVANAIAAMLLTQMITAGATAVFGDKWGAIIGAIASIVALNVGTAMAGGQTMGEAFSGLMRADNILQLTSAVGKGYSAYMQNAAQSMYAEQQQVIQQYEEESRQVRAAWEQNLGSGNGIIDPAMISSAFGVTMESMDSFLQRTLLTGSDVADMSMNMLTNFVNMTLTLDLPT